MGITNEHTAGCLADFFLDITGEVCPMTFVRTKLLLERLATGQTIEIRLKGSEPLRNVPRQVVDHGHTILDFTPIEVDDAETGVHRLVVRKG